MALPENLISNLTQSFSSVDAVLISLLVSTLAGGIVFLLVVELLAKKLHDRISVMRVFLAVFIINVISLPLVWGMSVQAIASLPFASAILPFAPLLIWFIVVELLFKDIAVSHSFIISIIGYILSILIIPTVSIVLRSLLPF